MYMITGGLLISNGAGPSKKPLLINRYDGCYCLRSARCFILVRFAIHLETLYYRGRKRKKERD